MKKNKFFGKNEKKWKWENFKSTKGFPIPDELLAWVIGQDKALEECRLCIDEWVQKLLHLKKKQWWKAFEDPEKDKPPPKEWLPSGPFLLMIGDAGTGKSLIGRALSTYMTDLYKRKGIELNDVLSWKNKAMPSTPKISIHPSGVGKKIVQKLRLKSLKKSRFSKWGFRLLEGLMIGFGSFVLGVTFYSIGSSWFGINAQGYPMQLIYEGNFIQYLIDSLMANVMMIYLGIGILSMGAMIFIFKHILGGLGGSKKGIGGAESVDSPKLIVDNSSGNAPFIDATGHGSSQLFGSIAWDPYQTGGLGTPEHQRVSAGDVHRAHLGVLYIDEIKNLKGAEATTLLTVLEDGQLSIALRSQMHGGDTAAMAVSTEPVPAMNFFIAAGNLDSVPQIHYALMDRIYGYGKVVYMNNDMDNSIKNRRRYIQFISQEIKRFNLLPFNREACIEVINESSRKSDMTSKLSTKFRPMISIIKTASILAHNEGKKIVEEKHVKEAIKEHCKTIQLQVLEQITEKREIYNIINPESKPIKGQIYGMAVSHFEGQKGVGIILPIKASVEKLSKNSNGYFRVTGVKTKDDSWVQNSISKVTTVIQQRYKHKKKLGIHIDFAQSIGIDGPSAGVAMALSLISLFEKKAIRQDTTVTGEINISVEDKILVTPIGGVREKILGAEQSGFKRVLIPKRNYEVNINPSDYKIKVIPCLTLKDYEKEILVKK